MSEKKINYIWEFVKILTLIPFTFFLIYAIEFLEWNDIPPPLALSAVFTLFFFATLIIRKNGMCKERAVTTILLIIGNAVLAVSLTINTYITTFFEYSIMHFILSWFPGVAYASWAQYINKENMEQ